MAKPLHHQIVARAQEIFSDRNRWVQGQLSVSDDGGCADRMDARARRFCAVAALRRAAHELAPGQTSLADQLQVALEQMVHLRHPQLSDCLENLNDDGDHATVLRLFDEFLASEVA
jgi:hypothetical protein